MNFYTYVKCWGNTLYFRGIRDGQHVKERREYHPVLFLPSQNSQSDFHTLEGLPVEPKFFDSLSSAKQFLKQYKNIEGFTIYGQTRFEYTYIADEYPDDVIEWSSDHIVTAFLDIETFSEHGFPEPRDASHPITAITVKLSSGPTFYTWGLGEYRSSDTSVVYRRCLDEKDLLENFLQFWVEAEPDIVSGWNIKAFDIPYLYRRLLKVFGESMAKRLSPFGIIREHEETYYQKSIITYELFGLAILDYLQLFRKYAANASQESYRLDHIASVELGQKKISYDEYETLHQLYVNDHQKYIAYNIHDVRLVEQLNAKSRLIELALTLAYDNKVNYEDVFTQVRMWDVICYNHLRKKNIVIPPKVDQVKTEAYEGAYVKDPQCGLFEWVVSFDLASLYPHLIMEFNLSPETICTISDLSSMTSASSVESLLHREVDTQKLHAHQMTLTPNQQLFSIKKQGFLPEIMERMFADRTIYKKKMLVAKKELESLRHDPKAPSERKKQLENDISRYNNLQLAKKVGLNSAYGSIGNNFFRFFDLRIAEAITLSGQLAIRWVEKALNRYLNTLLKTHDVDLVLAIDTDSVYLNLGPLVKKVATPNMSKDKIVSMLDTFCREKIQPQIDQSYQEMATYLNAYAQKMQMKRENIADQAIWTSKKRYLLNVYDQEGVRFSEPQLKIQGLEAVKSSTPAACREKIKRAIELIFSSDESTVQEFISQFKAEFKTLSPSDVAFPRSVSGLKKYGVQKTRDTRLDKTLLVSQSGTPIHVKGSLVYNHAIKTDKLSDKYQSIQEGEKIKFVYLKEPNRFQSHVIAFLQQAPKEWQLETIIDYETQFEKSFLDPLKIILNAIDWKTERHTSLESFFT